MNTLLRTRSSRGHRPAGRVRGASAALAAFAALWLSGSALSQDTMRFPRLVARDCAQLLQHSDGIVRGEAARLCVLGASAPPVASLLAMAVGADSDARRRAILALGQLRSAPAIDFLAERLQDHSRRDDPDAMLWAYALGGADEELAASAIAGLLNSLQQGSYSRQREMIVGLLLGLLQHPGPGPVAGLLRAWLDDSNRDPMVRGLLLQLLLQRGHRPSQRELSRLLARGESPERLAALQWLVDEPATSRPLLATLNGLAAAGGLSAERSAERSAALAALTRLGHPPALELAAQALRGDGSEVAQALRTMLTLGGSRLYATLDAHLRQETDPERLRALLLHYEAPLSSALADHCARLAGDLRQPLPVRSAAAQRLAGSDPDRAAPLLRDLFQKAQMPAAELLPLARTLLALPGAPAALDRLIDGELIDHPGHWRALLAAEHPEAQRAVLAVLQQPDSSPALLRRALTAFRGASQPTARSLRSVQLPPLLQELLGP